MTERAIWLRLDGANVVVAVEVIRAGKRTWVDVISERADGCYSHIIEPSGIDARIADARTRTP